jgi:hypothetical protein
MKLPTVLIRLCLATWINVGFAAATDDHFGPNERVLDSFGWHGGASCTFEDAGGVIFHSNWQKRHWIRIDGKQVEFNGAARMSDPGWFQTFRAEGFAVTMRLRRTGDHGDGVSMVGQIIIERRGMSKTYEVKGGCGA